MLTYLYDDIGRLLQVSGNDGSYVKTSYDKFDKSTNLHYKFNGQRRDVYFNYSDRDNLPLDVRFGTDSKYIVENNYDELTRLKFKTYTIPSTGSKINTSYRYIDWSGDNSNRTTSTVKGIDYTYVAGGLTTYDRWYTYDRAGNILTEGVWTTDDTKPVYETYTYDAKNQLVKHDSVTLNATFTYTYDVAGNIKSKTIYNKENGTTSTIDYTYGNSNWKDELTAYGNENIEYDAIGNPTAYRGWTMSWQGRQLASASKDGTSLSYTYDSDGIRTSKTVDGVKTSYLLNGTQILAQTTNGKTLCFFYDQQGNRVAMADSSNHIYYYLYNLQGDVIALADAATGKLAATYTYDAWGRIVKINNQNPEAVAETSIAKINPFRYRGYYYDSETGLYYLQSRYYDAETGRFINADSYISTGQGVIGNNMFAYCGNNPIVSSDPTGEFIDTIFDVISLGMSVAEVISRPTDPWAWAGLAGDIIDLVPGVTGVGETVRAAKASKKLVDAGSKIVNKKYAGKVYKLGGKLADKYSDGVKFSKYGFPDFSQYAKQSVTISGLSGKYSKDSRLANKAVGLKSTPAGYTWHHVEDGRTMQLVPKDLHKAVRHTGGCAVIKYLN